MSIREQLLTAFEEGSISKMTANEICRVFAIPYREKKRLTDVLDRMVDDGLIFQDNGGRYGTASSLGLIKGKICGNERGFAFLLPEDKTLHPDDYFIPRKG